MDEREAIARLKQGDIAGLETLVRQYQVRALRVAFLITGEVASAEDVVQEAFLRAYERIDQFDSDREFVPWFLRIVANDAVKYATRQKRQVSWDDEAGANENALAELALDPSPGPEGLLERAELSASVGAALAALSPPRRAAVVLRYYLDLTEPEIANRLRWPLGTVKRRLHDARRLLRTVMGSSDPDGGPGEASEQVSPAGPGHGAAFPVERRR